MNMLEFIGMMTEDEASQLASLVHDMRVRFGSVLLDEPTAENLTTYQELTALYNDANAQVVYQFCQADLDDLEDDDELPDWLVDTCDEHEARFAEPDGPFDEPDDDEVIPF